MNMAEIVTVMGITTVLAVYTVPTALRATANAQVTGALLQLHQYSKQSRYDAIVNYGQVRSVAIYGGQRPALAECLDGVCGKPVSMPAGIVVKSTFRGINAKVAGKAGSEIATLISWASETNSGMGGGFWPAWHCHFQPSLDNKEILSRQRRKFR